MMGSQKSDAHTKRLETTALNTFDDRGSRAYKSRLNNREI